MLKTPGGRPRKQLAARPPGGLENVHLGLSAATKRENLSNFTIWCMKTNSVGSIALHQVNVQTCRAQNLKAYTFICDLTARELIHTEGSRAEIDQRWPAHN